MAVTYTDSKIDDVDNLYYYYALSHSSQIKTPNELPQFAFDSGSWNNEFAQVELDAFDAVYKTLAHTPSGADFGHMGMMFSFKWPSDTLFYTRFGIESHVSLQYTGGTGEGTAGYYIMNFTTGEWEKIGSDLVSTAVLTPQTVSLIEHLEKS